MSEIRVFCRAFNNVGNVIKKTTSFTSEKDAIQFALNFVKNENLEDSNSVYVKFNNTLGTINYTVDNFNIYAVQKLERMFKAYSDKIIQMPDSSAVKKLTKEIARLKKLYSRLDAIIREENTKGIYDDNKEDLMRAVGDWIWNKKVSLKAFLHA